MEPTDELLAARLTELRRKRGWTLEDYASLTGVSRATLSRIERCEVSPTAQVLGKLAVAFGLPMQALFSEDADDRQLLITADQQIVWQDPETGFRRRSVSPSLHGYRGTMIEGLIPAGKTITYSQPPLSELEHHLVLLEGSLEVKLGETLYRLSGGDCLRFRLTTPNSYHAPGPQDARYLLTVILP